MNELIQNNDNRATIRWKLLTTASSTVLLASVYGTQPAVAQSGNDPALWVEVGLQSSKVSKAADNFALPFDNGVPPGGLTGPLVEGLHLSRSYSEDGSLTFRPEGTDWVLSASVHFGRSGGTRHFRQSQTLPETRFVTYHTSLPAKGRHKTFYKPVNPATNTIDADTVSVEKHLIVDFQAGKDVGIGLMGSGSTSTIALGVRFAQLNTALNIPQYQAQQGVHISGIHETRIVTRYFSGVPRQVPRYYSSNRELWHVLGGNHHSSHDFEGVGPSISWKSSLALTSKLNPGGELLFDWGINAALLYGKQKNKADHHVASAYQCYGRSGYYGNCGGYPKQYAHTGHAASQKHVTVPNLGGFAGFSYRLADFKASAGYRVDYFYHAIDTGVAGQRAVTRGFQGPFASVSVGIP